MALIGLATVSIVVILVLAFASRRSARAAAAAIWVALLVRDLGVIA